MKYPTEISISCKPILSALLAAGVMLGSNVQAALNTGTVLTVTQGASCGGGVTPPAAGNGSCFAMEVSPGFQLYTQISGYNGVIIGAKQTTLLWNGTATSHTGAANGDEQLAVDNPWGFFGNTGLHQTTVAPTVITADTVLDFSGWNVSWNGIASIPMNARAHSTDGIIYLDGQAQITCTPSPCADESTYTLGYTATVPNGDPSGFGNVKYGLRLEGVVKVPGALSQTGATSLGVGSCATAVSSADSRLSEANLTTCSIALDTNAATASYHTRLFYDFTVDISASPGGNARVVIPLSAKTPASTIFRIYKSSAWSTFVADGANNVVSTAAGSLDSCPAAGSASYVDVSTVADPVDTKGHYCVQLTIQDNGPNDGNAAIGAIAVLGGVATGETPPPPEETRTSSSSGCSINSNSKNNWGRGDWWIVAGFIVWLGIVIRRRKKYV